MRLLLIGVLALLALAHADTNDNKWTKVFTSFFPNAPHTYADNYLEDLSEPVHVRVKRAVYAALGITSMCEVGWTGQFCENPVCSNPSTPVNKNSDKKVALMDMIYLPSGCTGNYYIPIDSMSEGLSIQIATNEGRPGILLTDGAGKKIEPVANISSWSHCVYVYQNFQPGNYQFSVNIGGISTSHCIATIETETLVTVGTAFVDTPTSDSSLYGESAVEGRLQNLVVHPFNLPNGVQPASATITLRAPNTGPLTRSLLTKRYNCGYEYFVGGLFTCSHLNEYNVLIEGVDDKGYVFRRTVPFGCTIAPQSVTTTPVPVVINNCYNGGTLLYKGTSMASCLCPTLFTGPECQEAQCMNGGSQLPEKLSCLCPDGYTGNNCEQVVCPNNVGNYLTDSKSLIVVIRAVQSMNQFINAIVQKIDAEYNYLSVFDAYRQFILVTYANGDYKTTVFFSSNYPKFLSTIASLNATATVGNCTDVTVSAIADVFKQLIYNKSPIYVFTDTAASDFDNWQSVTEANALRKLPIFSFFMNTTASQNCKVDELSAGYRIMHSLAIYSGGLLFTPSNGNFPKTFAAAMRSTTYKMNQVLLDDFYVCTFNGYRTFFADSATKHIIILVVGAGISIEVTDPVGKKYSPAMYQDGNNYFYTIASQNISVGEYLLKLSSTQSQYPCSYRVYAHSDYDLFFGTASSVANDVTFSEPVLGKSRALVAQLTGLNVTDQFRLFSEVVVVSNENGIFHKPLYLGNGIYRSGCGFHLFFGFTNFCEYTGQLFYATVYADDRNGFTIQRTTVGYCAAGETTPTPPTTCINGGVTNPANTTQCICPPRYTGRYCEQFVCQNGGIYNMGKCECPAGLGGTFCEEYQCTSTQLGLDFGYKKRSMSFVISVRSTMQNVWNLLGALVSDFVRDVQLHSPDWITKWNLVIVSHSGAKLMKSTSQSQGFIDAVQEIATNFNNYMDPKAANCSVDLISGLFEAAKNSLQNSNVFAFSDSDSLKNDVDLLFLMSVLDQKGFTFNLVQTASTLCSDKKAISYSLELEELIDYSNGWFIKSEDIQGVLNFIVSGYQSGINAIRSFTNCTKPQSIYVPVDGWTQSMTVSITGATPNITVTPPNGLQTGSYEIKMLSNEGLIMYQYIIPCDSTQWVVHSSYCYLYELRRKSFLESSQLCHSGKGFLVHIFNADAQKFIAYETQGIDVWIGLSFHNGKWYWDVPSGHDPMQLGAYTNWADGVDTKDPSKACAVIRATDGKWVPTDCSVNYYSICQKHRYGQGFFPGDSSTNLLPGGFWKVQAQTTSGGCMIDVRVQSEVQVYFGYVQDPHSDYPKNYGNIYATNNYVSAATTGLAPWHSDRNPSVEGRLNYVFMSINGTGKDALTFQDRSHCTYTMLSQNFACPTTSLSESRFHVKFSGLDQYGYTFDRMRRTSCGAYVTNCYHGGFLYQGKCVCTEGWTGNNCQTPVCLNRGLPKSDDTCECEPMFTGTHCEHALCEPPYPAVFKDKGRTLAIAIEQSTLMGSTLFLLKRNLEKIITNLNANTSDTSGWFNEYILYPFDSNTNKDSWIQPTITSNLSELITSLKAIPNGCPGGKCNFNFCPRPYTKVIRDILEYPYLQKPNSKIIVITRSSPEDYDLLTTVVDKLITSKAQLNFLFPAVTSPCGEGWDTPAIRAIMALVSYSGGGVFALTPPELVTTWLPKYFPNTYRSEFVYYGQYENCSNLESYFQIENSAYEFTINYFASNIKMKLYNPVGDVVSLPSSLISSTTNYVGAVTVNQTGATMAGTYKLVTSASGLRCFLDVKVKSEIELYTGYTQVIDALGGATQDDAHFEPVIGDGNVILVHGDGLNPGARIEYAQIVEPFRPWLIFTSEMRKRDKGCTYEYYSSKTFECYSEQLIVIISGTDERGAAFSRHFATHCISNRPRPPPPAPWCDITKTKNDFVFMVDSSFTAGPEVFGIFKLFMNSMAKAFGISSVNTQFGVVTISSKTNGFVLLNSCNTTDCLSSRISDLKPDLLQGQNLTSALKYISSVYTAPAQGYRANVRHNIVYLTASTSYTDGIDLDPVSLVYSIKRGGSFGFTLIGLGITPKDYMMSMANEMCSYYAKNIYDMGIHAANFLQSRACFNAPVCGM